jgi:hypothetical protein
VGRFSSLLGKVKDKKDELVRRAAGKAADVALDRTKKAALGAVDSVGEAIEKAIFGDVQSSKDAPAPAATEQAPDPFARLKAKERAEHVERDAKPARDDDVDAELEALKKRLGR